MSHSNPRARAEQAFKARTQVLVQERVALEQQNEARIRSQKTARLKALRLQRETDEAAAATPTAGREKRK